MQRIVLAYSGGLKSAIAVPCLADAGAADIVTVTLCFGEGRELEAVRDSALAAGAVRAHVLDVLEEFTKDFFLRALKAGAAHAPGGAPGLALSRAIVARKLIEIAGIERAAMIAHGCAASDTRIDAAIAALQPGARVVAPAREWTFTRDELASFARDRRVPLPLAADR